MSEQTKTPATGAERASWAVFGIALGIVIVAWVTFVIQMDQYDGEPEVALAIMTAALPLVGLGLVPALILTGLRQLLPVRSRPVDNADAAADDAHDGGGDAAGREHLPGDVREPDAGYTRSER